MEIKKILEMMKVNEEGLLEESAQAEIEQYISEVVELKALDKAKEIAKHAVEPIIAEAQEELVNEYEAKFDEYKEYVVSRFSDFVDGVLEENFEFPDEIVEYARKGQLYSDIIENLKVRIGIDEGTVDVQAKELLKEAKDEIISLRESLNEKEGKVLELKSDAREMATELYIRKKCDGLTESQKNRVMALLEGIKDKNQIDSKFEFIVENLFVESKNEDDNSNKKQVSEKECICPECGRLTSVTEGACELYNCPDCEGVKLTEKTETDKVATKKEELKNESNKSSFETLINEWTEIYKSKKI